MEKYEPYAWTMRTYYPGGRITPVGDMFRQPNLAATLRALAAAEQAALARGASREQAIDAGRAAVQQPAPSQQPAASQQLAPSQTCTEAVAALGLCPKPTPRKE